MSCYDTSGLAIKLVMWEEESDFSDYYATLSRGENRIL